MNLSQGIARTLCLALSGCSPAPSGEPGDGGGGPSSVMVAVSAAAPRATVSDRFLSVAIDSAQLVGGAFWNPGHTGKADGTALVPAFDFTRPRLAALMRPLGHAWLRLGGTDADRVYYDLDPQHPVAQPPAGYQWVLHADQWQRALAFAQQLDWKILFTLNAGRGPRRNDGPWQPDNAAALLAAPGSAATVGVWELGNEINAYNLVLGLSLSPAQYAADVATLRARLQAAGSPARLAGPSSAYWPLVGETGSFLPAFLATQASAGAGAIDVVTWHYYPQQGSRCPVQVRRATLTTLLDPDNLDEVDRWADKVEAAASRSVPRAEVWLGETSSCQCGGEPGVSSTFAAGFWWLDQLGRMALRGTPVVIRQSLTGADYGLLTEPDLAPLPDYWNSLLWRRFMGPRALAVTSSAPMLRAYAHCTAAGAPHAGAGAVTVLLLNLDGDRPAPIALSGLAGTGALEVYLVTGELAGQAVRENGRLLSVLADGSPPSEEPAAPQPALTLPPRSYAFVVVPGAAAAACP